MWHKTCADPGRGCRTAGPRSGGCCVHVAFCSHAWLPWDSWHTTLLAEVGQNGEGPLPWVERDYTPISTWSEWERAPCRGCPTLGLRRPCRADALAPLSAQAARATSLSRSILTERPLRGCTASRRARRRATPPRPHPLPGALAYPDQPTASSAPRRAHHHPVCRHRPLVGPLQVWLSSPMKTLTVPSLVVDPSRLSNHKLRPQGVMLVLAGTGIVVLAPQMRLSGRETRGWPRGWSYPTSPVAVPHWGRGLKR